MILKRMKRRHARDGHRLLRRDCAPPRPDVAFGADLIAGFPDRNRRHVRQQLRSSTTAA